MADISWLTEFPAMSRENILAMRQNLDGAYRNFSSDNGDLIEALFEPLQILLVSFENLLLAAPWWLVIAAVAAIVWLVGRSRKLTAGVIVSLFAIGYFGMWEDTMKTTAIITVATLMAVAIGLPIGIAMSRSDRMQTVVTPVLDVMQTMPPFVYLIPVVMLLGIGKVPGVIAVVIYAVPPVIRLTNLGIRLVDREVVEAATAFGANRAQRLWGVQFPLAMPTIMAGINQTIMMALAMVVIASMIGAAGLGEPVLRSITNQYFTLGLLNGLAVVALAIIFDRVSQAYAKRHQEHIAALQQA